MLSASQSGPAEVDEVSPVELKIVLGSALFLFVVVIHFIFNFQLIMKFPAHGRPLLPAELMLLSLPRGTLHGVLTSQALLLPAGARKPVFSKTSSAHV